MPVVVGLCGACAHVRVIRSGRGSTFYFCQRSTVDRRFPKYPPLPVLRCSGFTLRGEGDGDGEGDPEGATSP